MIARDSDASKKFYRTVITLYAFRWKYSMVHGMKPSPAFQTGKGRRGSRILGRQSTSVGILEYSSRNTPVLLWKYSSTAPRVLEYFRRSTAVLWAKYSNSLPGSIFSPYSPHFQDRQGITAQPRQRIDYTVIIRSFYANAYCGFTLMCARYWNRHITVTYHGFEPFIFALRARIVHHDAFRFPFLTGVSATFPQKNLATTTENITFALAIDENKLLLRLWRNW